MHDDMHYEASSGTASLESHALHMSLIRVRLRAPVVTGSQGPHDRI